jgi:hypothetical protein
VGLWGGSAAEIGIGSSAHTLQTHHDAGFGGFRVNILLCDTGRKGLGHARARVF